VALRWADAPSKESYRLYIGSGKLESRPRPNKRAIEHKFIFRTNIVGAELCSLKHNVAQSVENQLIFRVDALIG
jgi:hypothetical protein